MKQRRVVILAYPGLQSLDAVGPFEVFAGATRAAQSVAGPEAMRCRSPRSTGVRSGSRAGWPVHGALPDTSERIDTLVLPGGDQAQSARGDEELLSWIRTVAPRCRRVAAVCTGAFLAAEAGLLDGAGSRPTGRAPSSWPPSFRHWRSTPIRSTSVTASSGPVPASRPHRPGPGTGA